MSKRHLGFLIASFLLGVAVWISIRAGTGVRCSRPPVTTGLVDGTYLLGTRDPAGQPVREVAVSRVQIARTETTTGQFALYLNAAGWERAHHPQFERAQNRWKAKAPCEPLASVTKAEADAYCRWLSGQLDARVRLPTEDEWEAAARGGIRGAPYPWGWEDPAGRACFHAEASGPVGRYPANPLGGFDFSGNVAEWCQSEANGTGTVARGGSFADREVRRIAVWSRAYFPADYNDADVGFRIVIER